MDESLKQRVMVGVVTFNLTAMLYQFLFNTGRAFAYPKLLVAIAVGAVAGGLAALLAGLARK